MNRLWIGAVLLVCLLAGGLLLRYRLTGPQEVLAADLEQAAQLSLTGEPGRATDLARLSQQRWEDRVHFLAAVTDHSPIEQIQTLFAELSLLQAEDPAFPGLCLQLAQTLHAIAEAHDLKWWSLL